MPNKKQEQDPAAVPSSEAAPETAPQPARRTKQSLLLQMVSREGGATLEELASATGWLPHTVRAAITGVRKRGHNIVCERRDGESRYVVGSAK